MGNKQQPASHNEPINIKCRLSSKQIAVSKIMNDSIAFLYHGSIHNTVIEFIDKIQQTMKYEEDFIISNEFVFHSKDIKFTKIPTNKECIVTFENNISCLYLLYSEMNEPSIQFIEEFKKWIPSLSNEGLLVRYGVFNHNDYLNYIHNQKSDGTKAMTTRFTELPMDCLVHIFDYMNPEYYTSCSFLNKSLYDIVSHNAEFDQRVWKRAVDTYLTIHDTNDLKLANRQLILNYLPLKSPNRLHHMSVIQNKFNWSSDLRNQELISLTEVSNITITRQELQFKELESFNNVCH
jgi:hypothetical protein